MNKPKYRIVEKFDAQYLNHYYVVQVRWLYFWFAYATKLYSRADAEMKIQQLISRQVKIKEGKGRCSTIAEFDKDGIQL